MVFMSMVRVTTDSVGHSVIFLWILSSRSLAPTLGGDLGIVGELSSLEVELRDQDNKQKVYILSIYIKLENFQKLLVCLFVCLPGCCLFKRSYAETVRGNFCMFVCPYFAPPLPMFVCMFVCQNCVYLIFLI